MSMSSCVGVVNIVGRWTGQGVVAVLILAPGCVLPPSPPPPPPPPDVRAVVTVVEDVYGRLGDPARVFLGADGVQDTTMARVRTTLGSDLTSAFHPPSERASGDPGASIALGRFNLDDDGHLSVVASFVQEDGGGRGCTEYTLEREGEDWVVAEAVDAWPDCPISDQGQETYHAVLARARSVECLGLWSNVGTCGEWLYVGEGLGHTGTIYYFDASTGLAVAQEWCTDVVEGNGPCHFVFGSADCEPDITETILCDR